MSESSPQLSYVARVVRDFDRERFVTALFAPSERREALLTLYAFNSEIARVRESVREPMAGMIRLQWWRDVLGHGAAGGARHPIAEPLCRLIAEHGLALASFERVLEGREADLDSAAPADLDSAVAYADATGGEVAVLAARLLGGTGMDEAARHVGIAWALVGQCRALAFHLSIGRLTLPEAVLVAAGTDGAQVLAGKAPSAAVAAAVEAMAGRARHHLAEARRHRPQDRTALAALLPAVLAERHLAVLERAKWNPFDARVVVARSHPLRLAWANVLGRY